LGSEAVNFSTARTSPPTTMTSAPIDSARSAAAALTSCAFRFHASSAAWS
jgi:hypothetical protein